MPVDITTKRPILIKHRYWFMAAAVILTLPPLSFLFQITGDTNFCGTWCPRMFFVWRQGMSAGSYLFGFLRSYMGVAIVFGALLTTFFLGRYWCSHLCPIGGTMELGSKLVPKFLKIDFSRIPASAFRYGYLSVYFLAAAAGIGSLCCSYCHFAAVPRIFGAAFSQADLAYFLRTAGWINLALVFVLGFFAKGGRAYCNLLCPIGALDALSNRLGIRWGKRVHVSAEACNSCGACLDVCPMWAIDMAPTAQISQHDCIPCRRCEAACSQKAISYTKMAAEPTIIHQETAIEKA